MTPSFRARSRGLSRNDAPPNQSGTKRSFRPVQFWEGKRLVARAFLRAAAASSGTSTPWKSASWNSIATRRVARCVFCSSRPREWLTYSQWILELEARRGLDCSSRGHEELAVVGGGPTRTIRSRQSQLLQSSQCRGGLFQIKVTQFKGPQEKPFSPGKLERCRGHRGAHSWIHFFPNNASDPSRFMSLRAIFPRVAGSGQSHPRPVEKSCNTAQTRTATPNASTLSWISLCRAGSTGMRCAVVIPETCAQMRWVRKSTIKTN